MYEAFWHLEQAPFVVTPDVRFLLRARSHHESLSALLTGIARETGVMMTLRTAGFRRVAQGDTTLEEVMAVVADQD